MNQKIVARLAVIIFAAGVVSGAHAQSAPDAALQRRLALSAHYVALTHRETRLADTAKRALELAWKVCTDSRCQEELDKIIVTSVADATAANGREEVEHLANYFSEDELQAVVQFYSSDVGQKIVATSESDTDDRVKIAHDFGRRTAGVVYREFCPSHPKECARLASAENLAPAKPR